MSKVFLLIPTIPKVYQPPRFIIAHAKFVTTRTYICIQLIIYNSCRDHAKLIIPPHIISSQYAYSIPPIPSHNSIIEHSSTTKRQENPKLNAFSLNPSLRLRSLAQARVPRSGEFSPPRREFANLEQEPPHVLA